MPDSPSQTYLFSLHQLLVPIDLTAHSLQAFRLALRLAARAEAEVTAVHVIPPMLDYFERILFPYAALGSDRHTFEAELLEGAKQDLLTATDAVRQHMGADGEQEIYAHLYHGPINTRLSETISRTSADLVLCGAFGDSPPTPGHLGSVAHRLITRALRPTLLVKTPSGPLNIRQILVAFDTSKASAKLLNWALSLAFWFNANVELATIVPDPRRDDPSELLGRLRINRKDLERQGHTHAKHALERAREKLYIPFPRKADYEALNLVHHVRVDDPLQGLLTLADERAADLVIVASRHPNNPYRARFGRVADGLCRLASAHVLVIPAELTVDEDMPQ